MLHADPERPARAAIAATPSAARSEIALTGVYEISKILTSASRLETMLANVVNLLASFMQMRHGVIALLNDDGIPDIAVGAGWTEEADDRFHASLPQKAVGQVIVTGMPLVVPNIATHPLFEPGDVAKLSAGTTDVVSFIGVPIRIGQKVVGTLTIDRAHDAQSAQRLDFDVRFLVMVANLIGQTVQLHRVLLRDRERLMTESHRLQKELDEYKPRVPNTAAIAGIVGDSPAIRSLLDKVAVVARSRSPVLLRGESGTGKELFARAIHDLSACAGGPFIKVNCAALPESVLESELFGHEKGAFTGAIQARKGRFELAHGGTLFLDEIGEMSLVFQAKLLRVLQEGEFERVGGTKTIKVAVRLVTATNRNLEDAVSKGEFRADLYYRINVVPVILPPLRDRKSDIPLLSREFLARFNTENGRELELGPGAVEVLTGCCFPGNVRELENCVRRAATLAPGPTLAADDFACRNDQCVSAILWKGRNPQALANTAVSLPAPPAPPAGGGPRPVEAAPPEGHAAHEVDPGLRGGRMSERERLVEAMERAGWVQAKAARLLGLTPRQIGYALKKHGVELKRF
ncbi:nif-specific transcriptional activator NifA [Rhodoplanes sp. TEM]|uniref:Nif-specific regulatory protein n=1 Tax=Rhodoplanes tepidamans TaxID=200616 RepID=A0ABT5JHL8_RHOTP|nr:MULTISPECIES: nif-specific transcriptional activator NifA [Rhodoplanes]MDC7789208.1 nif-specific transcriptional activator NifA [Rhodoplanes tepidamans]MDC7985925.1 nif-specific transcriptional activator NifA [Rhodoplanes sp. TEM]MDQ0357075.1 Nif-specific regulatory protein [Rhodoplanes tepidamans]